jgi:hypothetical protein
MCPTCHDNPYWGRTFSSWTACPTCGLKGGPRGSPARAPEPATPEEVFDDTIVGKSSQAFPTQDGGQVVVTVVLVKGQGPDCNCYAGVGAPEFVALRGTKLSLREAEVHFPAIRSELQERGWRYRGLP